ncbi:hypothetical protein DRN74_01000 [Candidatus Micrarchaeota archaeon]|nr:MAG: hypothetical protein DRN74_01000 [Candidatus Micrarchaeota archaeon]
MASKILEHPALKLSLGVQDIITLIEEILREKNWKKFELLSFKLLYSPIYIFNYDLLVEQDVEGQTFSKGFSGTMAINAVTAELEPVFSHILKERPVEYEKEISHDFDYELEKASLTKDELKETCKIKLAAQFNVGKDSVAVSGFRLLYWPIWRVFVTLPKGIQRINVDAVSGQVLNISEVPEKEKTWLEITADTLKLMKKPEGWLTLSKKTVSLLGKSTKASLKLASKASSKAGEKASEAGLLYWLFHTRSGIYTLIAIALLILVLIYI